MTNKNNGAVTTIIASTAATSSLADLEKIISSHFTNHLLAAEALSTIRDQQLYRPEYKTFEDYCSKRWGYSRSYGIRLADMHQVMIDLEDYKNSEVYPKNEAQARVFVGIKDKSGRVTLAKAAMEDTSVDTITAATLTKLKKECFPDETPIKQKKPTKTACSVSSKLKNAYDSAKKVHEKLMEDEAEGDLVTNLGDFIEAAKSLIETETKEAA